MSLDNFTYIIMCLIALTFLGIYLYIIYKEEKKKTLKKQEYINKLFEKLESIERSINNEKEKNK